MSILAGNVKVSFNRILEWSQEYPISYLIINIILSMAAFNGPVLWPFSRPSITVR